ncbi:MAG: hypothetical protein LKE53_10505 [Oscillospiraceae bacterium]|jgi:hypothetical protein|nr:hypothetical protein [Oscillospiraceae bacterium]MDD3230405.1 hypothetical protein [Oscillospiraceae bacterium]
MDVISLCNLSVELQGELSLPQSLQKFRAAEKAPPCLRVRTVHAAANPHLPEDFRISILAFAKEENGDAKQVWNTYSDAALLTFEEGGCASLSETDEYSDDMYLNLLLAAFLPQLAQQNGLMMHASLVECAGGAVVFTASPGVGKSTQAKLWQNFLGARILNGDKAFIRSVKGRWDAYGSPWCGSSEYVLNAHAPLRAVVVLQQAKQNRIRRLSGMELLQKVTPHIYYPSWKSAAAVQTMQTLDTLLADIPVYLLSCLPNREAALLTRNTLFGEEGNGHGDNLCSCG